MKARILDSEGVTLISLLEVDDNARHLGIVIAIPPTYLKTWRESQDEITGPSFKMARAEFEQFAGDGVAIFRRQDDFR